MLQFNNIAVLVLIIVISVFIGLYRYRLFVLFTGIRQNDGDSLEDKTAELLQSYRNQANKKDPNTIKEDQ